MPLAFSNSQSHGSDSHTVITTAAASKEIMFAAGALQAPKVLELSGVGSKKVYCKVGYSNYCHQRNVGENLQDHINREFCFEFAEDVGTMDDLARQKAEAIEVVMGACGGKKDDLLLVEIL